MKKFYLRKELNTLEKIEESSNRNGKLTIITGKRGSGKTTLVNAFTANKKSLYLFSFRYCEEMLCEQWREQIEKQLGLHIYGKKLRLKDLLEQLFELSVNEHFILVIDEFQELQYVNPSFYSYLQYYWDKYERITNIHIIAIGSSNYSMTKIFSDSKEPLFGRSTNHIRMKPFPPSVCKEILKDYNENYTPEDLLCLYMITGGVGKYIFKLLETGAVTKEKMIECVCSDTSCFMFDAKDSLISEIGKDYATYFSILALISKGYTKQSQIDSVINKNTGSYLANLYKVFDVIKPVRPILSKESSRNIHYQITDCYYRFYFRFIYPNYCAVENGQLDIIKDDVFKYYESFSTFALEEYFKAKINEEQSLTNLGSWWDKKDDNLINIVAINDLEKICKIYQVTRGKGEYNPRELERKVELFKENLDGYKITIECLSMEDM